MERGEVKLPFEYIFKGNYSLITKPSGQESPVVPRDRDASSGEFTREYDDEEFIEALDGPGMSSTKEVSDTVGCSYTLAYHRLNLLAEKGEILRIEIGNSFAWSGDNSDN